MRVSKDRNYGPLLLTLVVIGTGVANSQPLADFSVPVSRSRIWAMALQPDQRILFGGDFLNSVAGHPCENLGRLNPDGSFNLTFHPKGAGIVTGLAVQADGKILVGGGLTNLAGQICTNLARLNPDGSADNSFTSPNPNGVVLAFCIQPDGRILLAGDFTSLAGATNQFIARLNSDGSLDSSFNPVMDLAPIAFALQPDGKILLAGGFTRLNGESRNGLGRLKSDGSLDPTFKPAVSGEPWSMALQADGKILVSFWRPLNIPTNTLTYRLNPDGSLDTTFNAALHATVNSLAPQADGKILALYAAGLVRLNADGGLDGSFTSHTNSGTYSCVLRSDGLIVFAAARSIEGRTNTEAAFPILTYQNGIATWSLGATSPDVATSIFDYTTNGADWVSLGEGTRTSNGWQLSGVIAPLTATLRVRGGVTGAFFNGSFWIAQSFFGRPIVSLQPVGLTNYVGTFNRLNVNAGGSEPLFYQWFKDGSALTGATNSALDFTTIRPSDAGTYELVVSNQFAVVGSSPATVRVLPLPRIAAGDGNLGFTNGDFGFNIYGQPAETVVVEWSGNLLNWVSLRTNVLSSVPFFFSEVPPAKYPRRFYRLRVPRE